MSWINRIPGASTAGHLAGKLLDHLPSHHHAGAQAGASSGAPTGRGAAPASSGVTQEDRDKAYIKQMTATPNQSTPQDKKAAAYQMQRAGEDQQQIAAANQQAQAPHPASSGVTQEARDEAYITQMKETPNQRTPQNEIAAAMQMARNAALQIAAANQQAQAAFLDSIKSSQPPLVVSSTQSSLEDKAKSNATE